MTNIELRKKVIEIASSYIGTKKYDEKHLELINYYNTTVKPLPVGYEVQPDDSYCATACTAWFWKAGLQDAIYSECGVDRMIKGSESMKIWNETDDAVPTKGDLVTFNWKGKEEEDNKGTGQHIALVEKVEGNTIHLINPNSNGGQIVRSTIQVGDKNIRGFIVPAYEKYVKPEKKAVVKKCFKLLTSYDPKDSVYCNIEILTDGKGIRNWVDIGETYEVVSEKDGFVQLRIKGKYEWTPWYPIEFVTII